MEQQNYQSEHDPFYIIKLRSEYQDRKQKNPRYSLKAFATSLGLSSAGLSRIIERDRIPNIKTVEQIIEKLDFTPTERRAFVQSSLETLQNRIIHNLQEKTSVAKIPNSIFEKLNRWYHFAIIEITLTEGFISDEVWIAKRFGLTLSETKKAIQDLIDLNFLERTPDQKIVKIIGRFEHESPLKTNTHMIALQRQFLEQAIQSLENDPVDIRSVTSMTVAIDPSQIPLARKMIQDFSRNICDLLKSGNQTEVYNLNISLYPLSKKAGTTHE